MALVLCYQFIYYLSQKTRVEKCAKYRNGIPTEEWIATIVIETQKDETMIGYSIEFSYDLLPAVCVYTDIDLHRLIIAFRRNGIGILRTLTIGHLHYIYFLRNSTEN